MPASTNNDQVASGRSWVSYMDLSGGLNTKRDPHAVDRNQLTVSQNAWYGTDNAVSKRPGTAAIVTSTGATGAGGLGTGLGIGQFNQTSYILSQQGTNMRYAKLSDTSWSNISTAVSGTNNINTAQMYDPTTGANQVFIVDGVNTPKMWAGPGNSTLTTVTTSAGYLPQNFTSTGPITPAYVITDGQNCNLVYAGEPTAPSAVYISDPFYPQKFSFSATSTSSYPGTYSPYIIGQNDGVNGGNITGLAKLGTNIVVFKESAIYFMSLNSVYGDLVFTSNVVSASTGCVAPNSIVAFDQYVCFLSIDGAYTVDIYGNINQITRNIPTFFDNTLTGFTATCQKYTNAVGVRAGSRYFLFYDAQNLGYPNSGLWFDFAKPDATGMPGAGEILGYTVGAAIELRGPKDDGNFVWTDATQDRIGKFGIGFSDFGSPISTTIFLKADTLYEEYGPQSPAAQKYLNNVWLDLSIPLQVNTAESLQFLVPVTTDYINEVVATPPPINVSLASQGLWDTGKWGTMYWASGARQYIYTTSRANGLQVNQGRIVQMGVIESSIYPWTLLGITAEFDSKGVLQ